MSIRMERVARLVQREIAQILGQDYAEQLQPMVTVTGARVTKDLSIAYIYVSVMGATEAQRKSVFKHLEGLAPQVRTDLAGRIRHQVRTIPEIRFFLDESQVEAERMEHIFERIRAERERRSPDS
ncbi:MAG: 30S ribosome-binding factor RbfA [Rhodothermales bacterium]